MRNVHCSTSRLAGALFCRHRLTSQHPKIVWKWMWLWNGLILLNEYFTCFSTVFFLLLLRSSLLFFVVFTIIQRNKCLCGGTVSLSMWLLCSRIFTLILFNSSAFFDQMPATEAPPFIWLTRKCHSLNEFLFMEISTVLPFVSQKKACKHFKRITATLFSSFFSFFNEKTKKKKSSKDIPFTLDTLVII